MLRRRMIFCGVIIGRTLDEVRVAISDIQEKWIGEWDERKAATVSMQGDGVVFSSGEFFLDARTE